MDHQNREQLEKLYRAALAKPVPQRDRFLDEACEGNQDLRLEVEALLRQEDGDVTQTILAAGRSVGPYEILAQIGAGGMGEIYRARDTRLGRPVAIKFLLGATLDRASLERFRREAKAISALNHPNVCTIYDIGEQDGHPYLVMELLDGQTLKQRIASGISSNDQILDTLIPILEALEAAHASGIVHRDIKPANIFLTKSGIVKILDFGLAKTSGPGNAADLDDNLTTPGTTMGTASYMSPEQARGDAIDSRADLFSCGVVLYETATGKRPFDAGGWAATVAAVINRQPQPARELNPNLLPEIERVIDRALEKDPAARYQTAADMRGELLRIKRSLDGPHAPTAPIPSAPPARPVLRYAALAVPVLLAAAGLAWYFRGPKGPVTVPSEYVQITNFSDYATAPALSRDGRMVAFFRDGASFQGTGQIYVKLLPDGESKRLTDDPNQKYDPVFTPDGSRVAYTVHNLKERTWSTWTVPVLGGPATRLMPNTAGLSWYGNGRIVFSEIMAGTVAHMGIETAREDRGDEHEVYFPDHERAMAHYSYPSPDQHSILIVEMDRQGTFQRCRVVPIEGGSAGTQVGPSGACIAGAWSPDNRWMYFNVEVEGSTHLWRQRVPNGPPEQITFGPTEEEGLAMGPDGKYLITSIGVRRSSVSTHDASGDHPVSVEGSVSGPRLSPDGKRLYYLMQRSNSTEVAELWSRDLTAGTSDPLLTGQRIMDYDISPDQARVAFTVQNGSSSQIFLAPLDRSSPPRLVTKDGENVSFAGNETLIFLQLGEKANYLARIQADGSGLVRLRDTPATDKAGVSPDGEWVAISGKLGGEKEPAGAIRGSFAVSTRDGSTRVICKGPCVTRWSSDGKYLYVTTNNLRTSSGRTLVVPLPRGLAFAELPAVGLDFAAEKDLAGIQVIHQGLVSPGPDPQNYVFVTAAFQGNLFRIPLH
ncbi:MAG TPA: protein kinase [Bryobacteraceae bacterium]